MYYDKISIWDEEERTGENQDTLYADFGQVLGIMKTLSLQNNSSG